MKAADKEKASEHLNKAAWHAIRAAQLVQDEDETKISNNIFRVLVYLVKANDGVEAMKTDEMD